MWGDAAGSHLLGALVIAYGVILAQPEHWQWYPLIFAAVYAFRIFSIRPLLAMTAPGGSWIDAFGRAALFVAFTFTMYVITHEIYHLIESYLFLLTPVIYYLAGKQTRYTGFECVAVAELFTGVLIGACAI